MRKNIFVISITLLITISALGCASKADQTEDVLKTTTVEEQQKTTDLTCDKEETNTSEIITQETTTNEETISQNKIETSATTIGETTTKKETTTQKQTTTSNTTQQKTTTRQETTTQKTTTPATTAKEVATEEQTTVAPVVEKETVDFSKAKEAFKEYVAENYANISGYNAVTISGVPMLYIDLQGVSRLLTYYNNSIIDSEYKSTVFYYYYTDDRCIWDEVGFFDGDRGGGSIMIYKLDNSGHIILDSKYHYKIVREDDGTLVSTYYEEINGIKYEISESEWSSAQTRKGLYGGTYKVDFNIAEGDYKTIDEAFTALEEERMQ